MFAKLKHLAYIFDCRIVQIWRVGYSTLQQRDYHVNTHSSIIINSNFTSERVSSTGSGLGVVGWWASKSKRIKEPKLWPPRETCPWKVGLRWRKILYNRFSSWATVDIIVWKWMKCRESSVTWSSLNNVNNGILRSKSATCKRAHLE